MKLGLRELGCAWQIEPRTVWVQAISEEFGLAILMMVGPYCDVLSWLLQSQTCWMLQLLATRVNLCYVRSLSLMK